MQLALPSHGELQHTSSSPEEDTSTSPYQDFQRLRDIVQQLAEGEQSILEGIDPSQAHLMIESVESEGTMKERRLRLD